MTYIRECKNPKSVTILIKGGTEHVVDEVKRAMEDSIGDVASALKTGKVVGNDLQEGKMTLPLIYALENAAQQDINTLLGLLNSSPENRKKQACQAKDLIKKANGFQQAKDKAKQIVQEATDCLLTFPESQDRDVLIALSQYVLNRDK